MKKVYAVAETVPPDCNYLTAGKEYEVKEIDGTRFSILSEDHEPATCKWVACAHLDGGNWKRIEREK